MTSVTIQTDTSGVEDIKLTSLTVEETGHQFLVLDIGDVTILLSYVTARALFTSLSNNAGVRGPAAVTESQ